MDATNPGSREAIAKGCTGSGYMGGVKDKDGNTLFVYSASCPVHKVEGGE